MLQLKNKQTKNHPQKLRLESLDVTSDCYAQTRDYNTTLQTSLWMDA